MSEAINPYRAPRADEKGANQSPFPVTPDTNYRPWSRGRTYVIFILGMHAVTFMMFFFHPVFPLVALGFGIPAYITANREIAEMPQAANHPFIIWGRRGGLIGLIGGPIATFLWILVLVIVLAVS